MNEMMKVFKTFTIESYYLMISYRQEMQNKQGKEKANKIDRFLMFLKESKKST